MSLKFFVMLYRLLARFVTTYLFFPNLLKFSSFKEMFYFLYTNGRYPDHMPAWSETTAILYPFNQFLV